ncbi:MAG: MlaD family protein [Gammaproteobacteria bacterium]|nr:MlaD family protein [Gammaproteobacteria bacterium]
MENRSHALIAIIFLAVFALGAVVIVWWMMVPGAARVPYLLNAKTSIGGLGQGSGVQFNGVQIGVVQSIKLDPKAHSIRVRIMVNKDFPIPRDSYATAGSGSLIGPTVVNIHLGKSDRILETSPENPAELPLKQGGLGAMIADAKSIMDKAKETLDSIQQIASKQNAERVTQTLKNIQTATKRLVKLEEALAPAAQQMPELIAEVRATVKQARALLEHANRLVVAARAPLSAVGQAAQSTAALTRELNRQTVPQLNETLLRLRSLSRKLEALATELKRAPQSLIVGPPVPNPGPGESRKKN